ncbi:MAG: hypothetical protein E4H40_02705 [Candidatus Brocadiia bacterium]|nr:MAG: hypothetical protein E4H40_02705 [Candidatus Brocadiia bacterium]
MADAISKYAYINAKLRARISMILPAEMLSQLAKAASLDALLVILRNTPFGVLEEIYTETGDIKLAELELLKNEIALFKDISKYIHKTSKQLVEALLYQFEIDTFKNAIRLYFDRKIRKRIDGAGIHYIIYEPIIHEMPMDLIISAESFDEIAGLCSGTAYSDIIKEYGPAVEAESSLFNLEVALDHFYYDNLLAAVNKLDSDDRVVALRLIGVEIDLQNISWIIRFKEFYNLPMEAVLAAIIPGGFSLDRKVMDELYHAQNVSPVLQEFVKKKLPDLSTLLTSQVSDVTSRLLLIGRILDEIRQHEVSRILAGYPFNIGIILAYFVLKRDELKKIRMLLNAKQYGQQQERIESLI